MIWFYRILFYLLTPFLIVHLFVRGFKNSAYFSRISQRFGFHLNLNPARNEQFKSVWVHAVSVGEVNAAIPLINALFKRYPDHRILVTTMTPTGSDRVKKVFDDSVDHCYLPYDLPGAVSRYINQSRLSCAFIMETEIWPNYILACAARDIPIVYTNVRLSQKSYERYAKVKGLFMLVLNQVSCFAVQSSTDAKRLTALGVEKSKIHVTGNIKFEIATPASLTEVAQSVRRKLGWNRPVWIAGSTHDGEEQQVLESYLWAKKDIPDLLLILAPRHPERFQLASKLAKRVGCHSVLYSALHSELRPDVDVLLLDRMGELNILIAASDVAFIGGSLVKTGGHNLLEASAAGVPVIFGPHMFNFQEISNLVLNREAGIQVQNSHELYEAVIKLIRSPELRDKMGGQGKQLVAENKGALSAILKIIQDLKIQNP